MKLVPISKTAPFLLFLILGTTAAFSQKHITQQEAIQLAEQFIMDNGYTTAPADKSKVHYELFDDDNIDTVLKWRYNSLQRKAFCISEHNDSWHVGFLYSKVDLSKLDVQKRETDLPGRSVSVMKDGSGVKMEHKDPRFSFFKKL